MQKRQIPSLTCCLHSLVVIIHWLASVPHQTSLAQGKTGSKERSKGTFVSSAFLMLIRLWILASPLSI